MARLEWDKTGEKTYETGVKNAVLYLQKDGKYPKGVAWNGITGITESPSGAETTALYADDVKYLNMLSAEEFGATVTAYTYPDEWADCNGEAEIATGVMIGQQTHKAFGLCFRTTKGNDTNGNDHGYKLHIIYNATAAPSERSYETINDSPDAIEFSWEISTTPVNVTRFKPTANITIDSTKCDAAKLKALEDILYGSESEDARLPLPDEIVQIIGSSSAAG